MPFDLRGYAKSHRYRLRDLSLGGPCPPAIWRPSADYERPTGLRDEERQWVIPGKCGYISDDGAEAVVGIYMFGVKGRRQAAAIKAIHQMRGTVPQIGDDEIAGFIPVDRIQDGLKLVKASKRPNRNPAGNPQGLEHRLCAMRRRPRNDAGGGA